MMRCTLMFLCSCCVQALKKFPCNKCESSFTTTSSLRRHIRDKHKAMNRGFRCQWVFHMLHPFIIIRHQLTSMTESWREWWLILCNEVIKYIVGMQTLHLFVNCLRYFCNIVTWHIRLSPWARPVNFKCQDHLRWQRFSGPVLLFTFK